MRRIVRIFRRLALYLSVAALGFVLGTLALYIYWVRSRPTLELWHTEELSAEFSTNNGDRFEVLMTIEAWKRHYLRNWMNKSMPASKQVLTIRLPATAPAAPRIREDGIPIGTTASS